MSPETYITYLEDIILALFAEKNAEFSLEMKSKHPSFDGFSFSSINVKEEISRQRDMRASERTECAILHTEKNETFQEKLNGKPYCIVCGEDWP